MSTKEIAKSPSLSAQVSRAVFWNAVFVPLRMVAEVAATLLKLTVLSVMHYALLALVSSASNGIGTAIDLGTTRALPKFIPEAHRLRGPQAALRLLWAVLALQSAALAVAAVAVVALRDGYMADLQQKIVADSSISAAQQATLLQFVHDHGWLLIGTVLLMLLFGIGYDVLMTYLNSFFRQRAWNIIATAAQLLPPLLSAAAILLGFDIVGVLVAMMIAPAVATLLVSWQVLRLRRELPKETDYHDDGRIIPRGFVPYCAVSYLMTMTDFIASKGFVVFLANDLSDVALLAAGASVVAMVLGYLFTPMAGVQVPLFTRVRAGEGGTLHGAYQSLVRLQILLLVPGGVGLLLLARPVFEVIIPKYVEAAPLVWVLVPCLFAECILTTAHNALIVYEHLRVVVFSRVLALAVIPLVFLLSPVMGVVGAALAFGLARVLAGGWATLNGNRILGLKMPWQFFWRVVMASVLMALVVAGLGILLPSLPANPGMVDRLVQAGLLAVTAAGGAVAFFIALRLLGGIDPQDRAQLLKLKLPAKRWLAKVL